MPITGSVGALTYAKIELNASREYWGYGVTTTTGTSTVVGMFRDSSQPCVYLGTKTGTDHFGILKINGDKNPVSEYFTLNEGTGANTVNTNVVTFKNVNTANINLGLNGYQFLNVNSANRGFASFVDGTTGNASSSLRMVNAGNVNPGDYFIHNAINDPGNAYYIASRSVPPLTNPSDIHIKKMSNTNANANILAESVLTTPGGFSGTPANKIYCASMSLTSTGNITVFYNLWKSNTETRMILAELNQTSSNTGYAYDVLPTVWNDPFYIANVNLLASQHKLDSTDNIYAVGRDSTGKGYFVKTYSNGTVQWQREVANVSLYSVALKDDSNIYVAGMKSGGNIWLAKYDNTGNIQWQNLLTSNAAFKINNLENSNLPDNSLQITTGNDRIFVGCQRDTYATVMCLPDNGNIPGNGSYTWSPSGTLTYAVATETEISGNLLLDTPASIIGVSASEVFDAATTTSSNAPGVSTLISYLG